METIDWRPRKWAEGTRGLSPEEKGVYIDLINETYLVGGPLPHDARWLAGICNCSVRRFGALLARLIAAGKIIEIDGKLHCNRCDVELERAEARMAQRRNARAARGNPARKQDVGTDGRTGSGRNGRTNGRTDGSAAVRNEPTDAYRGCFTEVSRELRARNSAEASALQSAESSNTNGLDATPVGQLALEQTLFPPNPHEGNGEGQEAADAGDGAEPVEREPDPGGGTAAKTDPPSRDAALQALPPPGQPAPGHSRVHGSNPRALGTNPRNRPPPALPPSPAPTGPPEVGRMFEAVRAEIGEQQFRAWLSPLVVGELNGTLTLVARSPFHRDYVAQRFGDRMRRLMARPVEVVAAGGDER